MDRLRALAVTLPFRALVAFAILFIHVRAMVALGEQRFFDDWQIPGIAAPHLDHPEYELTLPGWNRLLAARWDAEHYIMLAERGYSQCKQPSELLPGEFPDSDKRCQLNFYPTYGIIGRYVARWTGFAIDYALLLTSALASFGFLMLWTSSVITRRLGVGMTYLSLLLFNAFTFSFSLMTIQTEPLFLFFTLGSFYALARRYLWVGALAAGAATAVRISGVGVGVAYALALLTLTILERPSRYVWVLRGLYAVLGFWGIATLMLYFQHRFGDPLIYAHAHAREYHHGLGIESIIRPDTRVLMKSLWSEPFDGVILAACLFWFALGHRKGLERFTVVEQAFWYALFVCVMGISMVGSADLGYLGMSRYALGAIPLFFAMAGVMRRHPVVLAMWLYMSVAHYWGSSLCFYLGQNHPNRFGACGFARSWVNE